MLGDAGRSQNPLGVVARCFPPVWGRWPVAVLTAPHVGAPVGGPGMNGPEKLTGGETAKPLRPADLQPATVLPSLLAAAGIVYVLTVMVALHFLRPDLSPVSSPISEYAVGPGGALGTSALLIWGVASLVQAAGLCKILGPSWRSRTGLALFAVFGIGLIITSFFPMDVPFPPADFPPGTYSPAGITHILSATVACTCFPVAALLLAQEFAKDQRWRPVRRLSQALALASLAALAGLFMVSGVEIGFFGIAQRALAGLALLWQLLVAVGPLTTSGLRPDLPKESP